MMTGFPIAMLTKRTAVPGDPTAATSFQGGPTTIPTTLEKIGKFSDWNSTDEINSYSYLNNLIFNLT